MSDTPPLVAILDDVVEIREMLTAELEGGGFRTISFGRATEFEASLLKITPDICILDLGLPDKDGLALVHRLATESKTAVIIISGRAMVQDKIVGLELGADDYITKPFDPAEVVARARAVIRRGRSEPNAAARMRFGEWEVDFDRFQLTARDGETVDLSQAEAEVLKLFLRSPNRLITRDQMLGALSGEADESFDRAMDVRVSRLRTKLRDDPKNPRLIKTIYGAGYIFIGTPD